MGTIMLPIALVTAGAAAILNLWLAMRTGAIRRQTKISVGDGGNEALIRRMRAHANFIESAPFIVILIALIEFTTGTSLWLWVASALFLLARVAHPLGMDGVRIGREAGTLVTFALLLGLGGYAATLPFMAPAVHGTPAVSAAPAG
ncbi:MAPEG family protein [Sphingomonas glacialis]|uniref:MAPEG family protein n=1 Tax=Sphingomonas glacialis TaxID=658225 RepID=UPI001476F465|nr:MAPEG family protein [Sphingomonas glacialis]